MENLVDKKVTFFTVCNSKYLSRALLLAESLYNNSNYKLLIVLFEEQLVNVQNFDFDFEIILAKSFKFERFYELAFKYDVVEFTTSLKAYITIELLKNNNKVIFLDPDIYVINNFNSLIDLLDNNDVILTSHYNTPHSNILNDADLGMMRFGSFNLGFYAVNDSANSLRFLKWWNARCIDQCYFETQYGLSTDQKWVTIANAFFDFLYVIRDPGYNVAYWNLFERNIMKYNGQYYSNDKLLIFIHFSSFIPNLPNAISSRYLYNKSEVTPYLIEISNNYNNKLNIIESNLKSYNKKYSYDYFENGKYISITLRRAYTNCINKFPKFVNNFLITSEVYAFAKYNNLLTNKENFKLAGLKDLDTNSIKYKLIIFFLKKILLIIGPNNFFNLSRLFVYLSTYSRIKDFWKTKNI
jgi:hypothetical protein